MYAGRVRAPGQGTGTAKARVGTLLGKKPKIGYMYFIRKASEKLLLGSCVYVHQGIMYMYIVHVDEVLLFKMCDKKGA